MENQKKLEFLKRLWKGKKVISISNSFETDSTNTSMHIGTVVDVIPISKSQSPFPLVQYEGEEEFYINFATLLEYSDKLWATLNKLNAEERWDLIQAFNFRFKY